MQTENRVQRFTRIIIMLVALRNLINDRFFLAKLDDRINYFTENYIVWISLVKIGGNTQHKSGSKEFIGSINRITELINDLKYLNLVKDFSLCLQLERDLLSMKLEFLKNVAKLNDLEFRKEAREIVTIKPQNKEVKKLNQSKQKILTFIKSYPEKRTKEIIYEFNAISDRTVKRSLNELLKAGLIKKRVDNKASYYS